MSKTTPTPEAAPAKQRLTTRVPYLGAIAAIERVLIDLPPEMATLALETVLNARRFAIRQLELPFIDKAQQ